jgi:DNA/RNA endonuclease G (NUC1)
MIQRLGVYFPEAGGPQGSGKRDLQMTTLDPHDFDQPSLAIPNYLLYDNFYEPHVQVWSNVTFADNYYQTVPDITVGGDGTPAGRNIPDLPSTEAGSKAAGLQFPTDPSTGEPLGKPDLSVFLGTNSQAAPADYLQSRAGFTTNTRSGSTHRDAIFWYLGTADLSLTESPADPDLSAPSSASEFEADANDTTVFFRRMADLLYTRAGGDHLPSGYFDPGFFMTPKAETNSPPFNPWYIPEWAYNSDPSGTGRPDNHPDFSADLPILSVNPNATPMPAPWEGIGTGWFYSALGGGYDERPPSYTPDQRVPLTFDNTYDTYLRGDRAVPTIFNGSFNQAERIGNIRGISALVGNSGLDQVPGWSLQGGLGGSTHQLVTLGEDDAYQLDQNDKQLRHNRLYIPTDITDLQFSTKVVAPTADAFLNVKLETSTTEVTLSSIPLDDADDDFVTWNLVIPEAYRGAVAMIEFDLIRPDGSTRVLLDDVRLDAVDPDYAAAHPIDTNAVYNGKFAYTTIATHTEGPQVPGWSYNGDPLPTSQLIDHSGGVGPINLAVRLAPQAALVHDAIEEIPDWGILRFDVYDPQAGGGTLLVLIQQEGEFPQLLGSVNLSQGDGTYDLTFGTKGFETFQVNVPDQYRGQSAELIFENDSGDTVELDNVFFASQGLLFGNPDDSRTDPSYTTQYLIERPQYAASYSNQTKDPNWSAWELDSSWLGNLPRTGTFKADTFLPSGWVPNPGDSFGAPYDRGHLTPDADRNRTAKDAAATYIMTNVVPENLNLNRGTWLGLENFSRKLVKAPNNKVLYIFAGAYDDRGTILRSNGINVTIPDHLWKSILVLDPGQGLEDVTAATPAITIDIPNDVIPPNPDPTKPKWAQYIVSVDTLDQRLTEAYGRPFLLWSKLPHAIGDAIRAKVFTGPFDPDDLSNPPMPLGAGTGPDPAGPATPGTILSTEDPRVAALGAQAVSLWDSLLGVNVPLDVIWKVTDLTGGRLGQAVATQFDALGRPIGGEIDVDRTGAGGGWSLDARPGAAGAQPAGGAGPYDLVTVLLHEVGHLLGFNPDLPIFSRHVTQSAGNPPIFIGPGFTAVLTNDGDHLDAATNPGDLMDATLAPSVRERPSWLDARIIAATRDTSPPSPDVGARPSEAPIITPDRGPSAIAAASRGSFGRSTADAMPISPPISWRPGPLPLLAAQSATLANAPAASYRVETEDQETMLAIGSFRIDAWPNAAAFESLKPPAAKGPSAAINGADRFPRPMRAGRFGRSLDRTPATRLAREPIADQGAGPLATTPLPGPARRPVALRIVPSNDRAGDAEAVGQDSLDRIGESQVIATSGADRVSSLGDIWSAILDEPDDHGPLDPIALIGAEVALALLGLSRLSEASPRTTPSHENVTDGPGSSACSVQQHRSGRTRMLPPWREWMGLLVRGIRRAFGRRGRS